MFSVFFSSPDSNEPFQTMLWWWWGLYPLLEINLFKIKQNVIQLQKKCFDWNLEPVAVTKGFCADLKIVDLLFETGIRAFADSNLSNLIKLKNRFQETARYFLIRLPMKEEVDEILHHEIIPMLSQFEILTFFNEKAKSVNSSSPVMLAVETGDGREGFLPEELLTNSHRFQSMTHLSIVGIATSLACLSGALPQPTTLETLDQLRNELKKRFNLSNLLVSVGGTTFFSLWEDHPQLRKADQIRCGEAFLFGSDISRKRNIPWLQQGTFHIEAEIVEIKKKKSEASNRGFDAFGRNCNHMEESPYPRKRALVATGLQDIDDTQLFFQDGNVTIIGATSNYLVLDCEKSQHGYQVGDHIRFQAGYGAVLRAFLSPYVEKRYIE